MLKNILSDKKLRERDYIHHRDNILGILLFSGHAHHQQGQDGKEIFITEIIFLEYYCFQGMLTANGAKVKKADVEASNGVIHYLEAPLLEVPSLTIGEYLSENSR